MSHTAAPAGSAPQGDPAFYPVSITPPPRPLPLWRFLPIFVRNPLRALPEPVYHEPIVVAPRMHGMLAWITAPSLVERVLLTEADAFPKSPIEKRIFEAIIGDGILTAEGQSWRWQRRIVAPVFRHGELLALLPAMNAAAGRMTEVWRRRPGATTRAVDTDMTDATFDVLQSTIFAGATPAESELLKREVGTYLDGTSWDIAYELLRLPGWLWHPRQRGMRRSAAALVAAVDTLIARERQAGFASGGLMARLAAARDPDTGAPMSDAQMAHNLITFAAAGHETTAKAMTWTLYLLAHAQHWQERVRAEVVRVAGSGPIGPEHLDALPLTRRVIKEAMRLYPPAPVLGRMTREPITIGGHRLAAGAMLIIPVWAIHRHRKLWEDADRFDPDRFTPDREATYKRTQFMPFGFGPRTCIGMSFAMIEATVLLAHAVRAAHVSCAADLHPEPLSRVTLRPRNGMPLRVRMHA